MFQVDRFHTFDVNSITPWHYRAGYTLGADLVMWLEFVSTLKINFIKRMGPLPTLILFYRHV